MSWTDLVPLLFFVFAAVAMATVRARRMARILEIDPASRKEREHIPHPAFAPLLDAPDVAARLLAPEAPRDRPPALARARDLDLPGLLDALRRDFALQARGLPPVFVVRTEAATAGLAARPVAASVYATAEPELHAAFADERFLTLQAWFQAFTERPGDAHPYLWKEAWGLRRARSGATWELLQVLSCDVRRAEPAAERGPMNARLTPWPATGAASVPPEQVAATLVAVLDGLSGKPSGEALLAPVLLADLAFRAAGAASFDGGFRDRVGTLTEARPVDVFREGANDVARVAVDGQINDEVPWHFRECWWFVRPSDAPDAPWTLWRAEPLR